VAAVPATRAFGRAPMMTKAVIAAEVEGVGEIDVIGTTVAVDLETEGTKGEAAGPERGDVEDGDHHGIESSCRWSFLLCLRV